MIYFTYMESPKLRYIPKIQEPTSKIEGMKIGMEEDVKYTQFFENGPEAAKIITGKLFHEDKDAGSHDVIHIQMKSKLDSLGVKTPEQTTWENEMMVIAFQYLLTRPITTSAYDWAKDLLTGQINGSDSDMLDKYDVYRGYLMQLVAIFLRTLTLARHIQANDPEFFNSIVASQQEVKTLETGTFKVKTDINPTHIQLYHEQISKLNHCIAFAQKRKEQAQIKLAKKYGQQQKNHKEDTGLPLAA
jgi:hypothetical protein